MVTPITDGTPDHIAALTNFIIIGTIVFLMPLAYAMKKKHWIYPALTSIIMLFTVMTALLIFVNF